MAKLLAPYLFRWREVEAKSDLERLMLVLEYLPDEGLMQKLEEQRKGGRDDYPIRPVWNSVLAGVVYQHAAIVYSIINEEPQPVARYNNQVSTKLEDIVSKALAKDKEERYQHIDDLLADLEFSIRKRMPI